MPEDLAVVLDVAGTILRMYRVAKDLQTGILMQRIITIELIMERPGRALVVPNVDPAKVGAAPPDQPLSTLIDGNEDKVEISCSSAPVSLEDALRILRHSPARVADLQEAHRAVRAMCPDSYQTSGMVVDAAEETLSYTVSTGGMPYPGLKDVLCRLDEMGAKVYIASGDSLHSLLCLREYGISGDRIHPASTPKRKEEIVRTLKDRYKRVVMVGDGLNDIYALRAADLGVLTVQQDTHQPERLFHAADTVIDDIRDLPDLLGPAGAPGC